MARRSVRVAGIRLLAILLTAASGLAATAGCTPTISRRGGLLRSDTQSASFREAVQQDNGIPTAAQAGLKPCD